MNVKYLLESGLFERRNIRSGRIYQDGAPPAYGVIFTANASKSEDDLGLNPVLLLGAFLGSQDYPESEQDRFFEILGGYFYHDNYPNPGTTIKVFGIALDPEFGITEGGTTTLKEHWKLDDPQNPILDESHWSKEFGNHHGWTFIVTLKEREQYPHSDEPLKLFVYCPEIKDIEVSYGVCITDGDVRRRQVKFAISVTGGKPESWTWHFGDGTSESGIGTPPVEVEHFYEKQPAEAPRLSVIGRLPCEEIIKEAEMSGFEPCLTCPQITDVKYKSLARDDQSDTIELIAKLSRSADEIEWEFGDGSAKEKTSEPKITHRYTIPDRDTIYHVRVRSYGPEDCQHAMAKKIVVKSSDRTTKPWFWLQLIVAFLSATAFGTFLVFLVSRINLQIQTGDWLIVALAVQAILIVSTIVAWYQLAKSKNYQKPERCDWITIGWITMLAGLLDAFYIKNCCGSWWWFIILFLLGLSGFLFYTWIKKCMVKAREFVYYFIICFLAVVCVCYVIAVKALSQYLQ